MFSSYLIEYSKIISAADLNDKFIAKGASREVHKASFLGRDVVMKVISRTEMPEVYDDSQEERILNKSISLGEEASSLKNIGQHKNIVGFIGLLLHQGTLPFGLYLEKCYPILESPKDRLLSLRLCRGLCYGLKHIHEKGYVHDDIKEPNLLLGKDGELKVCDFGSSFLYENNSDLMLDIEPSKECIAAFMGSVVEFKEKQHVLVSINEAATTEQIIAKLNEL